MNDPLDIEDFATRLRIGAPVIGLDPGTRTIGVAISDGLLGIATPIETIRRRKFTLDAGHLLDFATGRGAGGIVIGLPVNMDGSEGPRAQSVRAFTRNLGRLTELPLTLWDERLSTAAVERTLIAADASRKRRAEVVDKLAATYILQGALDRIGRLRG